MIDHRSERLPRLEPVGRQRGEPGPFSFPVLSDRRQPARDAAVVVAGLAAFDIAVELRQGRDFRDRGEPAATKTADLTLNTALLMRSPLTRFAVERVEPVVRAEQRPPVVLLSPPTDTEYLLHCLPEVVVLDLHRRNPAQLLERGDMPLQERFLRQRRICPVDRLPRMRHPEHEDEHLRPCPREIDPELPEIDLRFRARRVLLWHDRDRRKYVGLRSDLRATSAHVIPHGRIPDLRGVLVDEPVPDPRRGVALLPRGSQIFPQHRIDRVLERPELRRNPIRDLPRRRLRGLQGPTHRVPSHTKSRSKLARA